MAGLAAAMAEHQVRRDGGCEAEGSEGGGGADEAVHDHDPAVGRAADHRARHGRDFKAAEGGEDSERIAQCVMERQACFDHRAFARQARIVDTSAAADADRRRQAKIRAHQRGGAGGVGNAHLTDDEDLVAGFGGHPRAFTPGCESACALVCGHRRPYGEIAGAARDFRGDQIGMRGQVGVHAHIEHLDRGPSLAGEDVHRRAAGEKIEAHLRGHRFGKGAHPTIGHAVVAGAYEHAGSFAARLRPVLNRGDLQRQRFEAAEGARGFGQLSLTRGGRVTSDRAGCGNGRRGPHDQTLLSHSGSPAAVKATWEQAAAKR